MNRTTETDILAHYGVKGMKWGVRKARDVRSNVSKERAKKRAKSDKLDLTYYEGKNLKKGMSSQEAKEKAQRQVDRNAKIRKTVMVSAAVGLTAAGAYVAYKKIDRDFRPVQISLDTPLKNINTEGAGRGMDRHLYVTYKNSDTNKYRGMLAKQYQRNAELVKRNPDAARRVGEDPSKFTNKIYETTLGLKTEVKAPSNRQAAKIYDELKRNNPRLDFGSYREFNQKLVFDDNKEARDKFFKEVSKKGYNAIIDTNDQWDSGYNTRRPIILMNAGKTAVEKHSNRLLDSEINKHNAVEKGKIIARGTTVAAGKVGLVGVVMTKSNRKDRRAMQQNFVKKYKKNNPNTKLSDAEIIARMP